MDTQLRLKQMMQRELKRYETLRVKLEKQQHTLPAGSIVVKSGQLYRAVRENGKQYFAMLTPDESDLIYQLKKKRYISKALPILEKQIKNCKRFVQNALVYDPESIRQDLPLQYHDISDLPIFLEGDINPDEWTTAEYRSNPMPISTPHFTARGIKTRSKSEEIIGTRLEDFGFSIRYEPEVVIEGKRFYPDFAILLKNIRRVVYWEHLGMVDNPEYVLHNLKKLEEYAKNGIYLGFNLVITYETKDKPLTFVEINQKIRELKAIDRI